MDLLAELGRRKVLAIIRADGPDRALACIRTLVSAGITALEVSLTTPGGVEAIVESHRKLLAGDGWPVRVVAGRGDCELIARDIQTHCEPTRLNDCGQVQAATAFPLLRADKLCDTPLPTADQLAIIARLDPHNLRGAVIKNNPPALKAAA